jgi:hypothetical protein
LVEIVKLLETLTKKDLADLMRWIQNQQNKQWQNPERPAEVQEWIDESGEKIPELIAAAKNDKNRFVREVVGPALERAHS